MRRNKIRSRREPNSRYAIGRIFVEDFPLPTPISINSELHDWTNNIRGYMRMLEGTNQLPCFYRNPDGSLVTTCDVCRKAYIARRNYQDRKENA